MFLEFFFKVLIDSCELNPFFSSCIGGPELAFLRGKKLELFDFQRAPLVSVLPLLLSNLGWKEISMEEEEPFFSLATGLLWFFRSIYLSTRFFFQDDVAERFDVITTFVGDSIALRCDQRHEVVRQVPVPAFALDSHREQS